MKHTKQQVSRFLMQSTLGADQKLIDDVAEQGIETWLDKQLNAQITKNDLFKSTTSNIWQHFRTRLENAHGKRAIDGDGNNPALPYKWYFHMTWWQEVLGNNNHLLRHRIAQALSEILVISDNSVLELDAEGMASYYDLLYKHAFGNYSDLLYGLSIQLDKNYAREIMPL